MRMATLIIKDLEQSSELDLQAMRRIVGGSARARLTPTMPVSRIVPRGLFASAEPRAPKVRSSPLLRDAVKT
jgi:hypothetical protein